MKNRSPRRLNLVALLCPLACAFLSIYGCGGDEGTPIPDLSVHFADPHLDAAVRLAINKPSGPIFPWDLAGLTNLSAPNTDITDLGGIQRCSNLTVLTLSGNLISDISPLRGLTHLVNLYLGNNSISDISPLNALTDLEQIELQNNPIKDIGPLQRLTALKGLRLANNRIGEGATEGQESLVLGPLRDLHNLTLLDLSDNQIIDILPLVDNAEASGLGSGDIVLLVNNPLSDFAKNEEVKYLTDHGVTVTLVPAS